WRRCRGCCPPPPRLPDRSRRSPTHPPRPSARTRRAGASRSPSRPRAAGSSPTGRTGRPSPTGGGPSPRRAARPLLLDDGEVALRLVQPLGPVRRRDHDVLEPEPEAPGEVDAGLDAERVARLERRPIAGHDVRLLVGLDADAVAGAVDEPVAQAGTGDDAPRRRVHLLTGYADTRRPYRLLLRVDQHGVRVAHLRRRLAHDEQARDVRA